MNLHKAISIFCIVLIATLSSIACNPAPVAKVGQTPVITSLTAEHPAVYPLGNTRIECVAADADGDNLTYQWTSNDGKVIGSGPNIIWEAPKSYGDFHIMSIVDDGHGNSANKVVTVTVIVRDASKCCK